MIAHRDLYNLIASEFKPYPMMTLRQVSVVLYLGMEAKEIDFTFLRQVISIPAGSLSRALDKLCERGLTHRRRHDHDYRRVFISLTEKGREFFGRLGNEF